MCPVSLEAFRDPRVLPCGHTLEYFSIKGVKGPVFRCPLCKSIFLHKERLPVNWLVAQFLGLNVCNDQKSIAQEQKDIAMRMRRERGQKYITKNLECVMNEVKKKSVRGECQLTYRISIPWHESPIVRNEVGCLLTETLQEMGFVVNSHKEVNLKIKW